MSLYKNKEWLYDQYINQNKTQGEISIDQNVSEACIWKYLKKFDIFKKDNILSENLKDYKWLHNQYIIENKSTIQIADENNITKQKVCYWLEKHNIDRKKNTQSSHLSYDTVSKINDIDFLKKEYIENERSLEDISTELNVNPRTIKLRLLDNGISIRQYTRTSKEERAIKEFIKNELNLSILENNTTTIGSELDIFIPNKNIAIEHNGLYWHSYGKNDFNENEELIEDKKYHLRKTEKCENSGIMLLHITDNDWNNKQDIVKSMIKSKLGMTERIYARKCHITFDIPNNIYKNFLAENHIQGYIPSKLRIGLLYENKLVSVMSFGKNRFGDGIELYRMCSLKNYTIVGGMKRMLQHAIKQYNFQKSIISYCNRSYSSGNSYKQLGFNLIKSSNPDYIWFNKNTIYTRYQTQHKTKLSSIVGDIYDPNISERDNMMNAGFRRYWGCGNLVFEYIIKE